MLAHMLRRLSFLSAIPVVPRYSTASYQRNREKNPTLTVFLSNGCYLKVLNLVYWASARTLVLAS